MKSIIHITSAVPATISVDGFETFNINTSHVKWVDIALEKDFYISFLPHNQNIFLPITTLNKFSSTPSVQKIPYFKNHMEIIYNPAQILSTQTDIILIEKKLGDLYIKLVKNEKTHLCISTPNSELLNCITPNIMSVSSETSGYFILKGITDKNTQYVTIINLSTNKIVINDEFNIIEEDNKVIKLLQFVNDISKHGLVYVFDKKNMSCDSYSIYKDTNPFVTENKKLIPLAFLQSIKYKDYNLSKYYLKDNLVSNEHLTSYFGNIKNIFYNTYFKGNAINYTVESEQFKSYNFYIDNNKISEIEEVSLF